MGADKAGGEAGGVWGGAKAFSRQLRSQQCGVVLGGIGTGGLELWDDGHFRVWQIFNNGTWTGWTGAGFRTSDEHFPAGGLHFALSTHSPDGRGIWKLQMPDHRAGRWIEEIYHSPELRFPQSIDYRARQPFAHLTYELENCPVEADLEAFTPLVPHDLDASAWPVAEFRIRLGNRTKRRVEATLAASLANVVEGFASAWARPHQIIHDQDGLTLHFPAAPADPSPAAGSMALTVTGETGELSYLPKWQAIGVNHAMFWGQLLAANRLGGDESKPAKLTELCARAKAFGWNTQDGLSRLSEAQRQELADLAAGFPDIEILRERIPLLAHADADDPRTRRDAMLEEVLITLAQDVGPFFGSVARTVALEAGQDATVQFVLTWRFPNHVMVNTGWGQVEKGVDAFDPADCLDPNLAQHMTQPGQRTAVGHWYERLGKDAAEIAGAYLARADNLQGRSADFITALHDTTLPDWLADAINDQFTSFVANGIYDRQGRFALWAGCGGCGFTELGNTFFSTFLTNVLFPDASKAQLEQLARFQARDGRMPHLLCDFNSPSGHYEDDNLKFILKVYCDWTWTGDQAYFETNWPRAQRVLEALRRLDFDGDGIPDMRGYNQDYDQWMMFGLGIYYASHWPAVLRVMAKMARWAGQMSDAQRWESEALQAASVIEENLWNGRWYSLYADNQTGRRDDSILANGLLGEWYARVMGLERSLNAKRVRSMLRAIYEHNRTPGVGLRNGWLPDGLDREAGLRDWHWNVCWMGVEYETASHLIYEGMIDEGLTVARESFERHINHGLRTNHFECGEHYIRAFTVWTVLIALAGLELDAANRRLRIVPVYKPADFRSVLLLPQGWGVFQQRLNSPQGGQVRIDWKQGELSLQRLELCRPASQVTVDGRQAPFATEAEAIIPTEALNLKPGQRLVVDLT